MGEKQEIYENKDKRCECWLCELKETCQYVDKYQRLPRTEKGQCQFQVPEGVGTYEEKFWEENYNL